MLLELEQELSVFWLSYNKPSRLIDMVASLRGVLMFKLLTCSCAMMKIEVCDACRATLAEHIVKEKETEKRNQEVHKALQVLQHEGKERARCYKKEHRKVMVSLA